MVVSVVSFSFSRAAQLEAQGPTLLGDGFLYCILSATSLGPYSSGAPRAPSAWCGFSYHTSSITPPPTVWLLSWLSYIIVQRPLDRPLNLWNGMLDRHQAEITVMQFRGHSLPVHHSEVGPSRCPILSAELTSAISSHNCHWNVSLPSGAALWMAFLAGSKGQNTTIRLLKRGALSIALKLYPMVRRQFWRSGENGVSLYYYYSQVHSNPELEYLLMG